MDNLHQLSPANVSGTSILLQLITRSIVSPFVREPTHIGLVRWPLAFRACRSCCAIGLISCLSPLGRLMYRCRVSVKIHPRRTKLVCTVGPASSSVEVLEKLIRAGLNVARLNFSHGNHEGHAATYKKIREAEAKTGRPIAILQDLQGPKIRLGKLDGVVQLPEGEEIILSSRGDFLGSSPRLPTTYSSLARDVKPGEPILLADGRMVLEVIEILDEDVRCRVMVGGQVTSNKGINLPGSNISTPSLTSKDRIDLEFGLKLGVDFVALSFVRMPEDVVELRELMQHHGRVVPIISKIEKPQAVDNLEEIVSVSDGLMVARGDLGVEIPAENVPTIQRRLLRLAREKAKMTVVATQMLVSMTEHPRPTHAEVSDVANAVYDGTDCVMLSEETAAGQFPVRTVETMASVVHSAENGAGALWAPNFAAEVRDDTAWAISRAACVTAEEVSASAIVSFTKMGLGPRLMSAWRPGCMVLGCATTDEEVRRMALVWGVRPLKINPPDSVESLVQEVQRAALEEGVLKKGDTVVITSKMPFDEESRTNMLKIHTL